MAMKLISNDNVKGESEICEREVVHCDSEPHPQAMKGSYEMLDRRLMAYQQ